MSEHLWQIDDLKTPYLRFLGVDIERFEADGVSLSITVVEQHCNLQGRAHGGMLASLLDAASGYSGLITEEGHQMPAVTLSLSIQYMAPAKCGDTLYAHGRVTGGGRRVFFTHADIIDSNGVCLASATGVFRRPSVRR
ncbi:PaaI family thioesterase [Larsenimonas suaedae]|uniref:PaaI family thioesterase n=1 Tax=Larsenimonas suaedae TaxID=1851019 RepID=A0ABU1GTC8_9GAMM|nr:PaaI family thioesterase [Larsenimonas suaedae]MCM2971727.1 PaaI family thioesterase [Larsenimonas suaedae]MDR5895279.1 PaaI family thioesterase [Larsenimonas suaedae]